MPACKHCGQAYQIKNIDDGYCSDDCWEAVNCASPEEIEELVEHEIYE